MTGSTSQDFATLVTQLRGLSPTLVTDNPIIKTKKKFYGAKVPALKKLAGEYKRSSQLKPTEVLELFRQLWAADAREEMLLGTFILAARKGAWSLLDNDWFFSCVPELDNWETCDQLAANVLGPWILADPQARFATCEQLVADDNVWAKRLGIAGTVKLARTATVVEFWPRIRKLLLNVSHEKEAALPKTVSWVMRTAIKHNRQGVEDLLASHRNELPAIAVRETEKKLATGKKT